MSKVITFSRVFPSYHPRKGEPTYFVEKFTKSLHFLGQRPWDIPDEIFSAEMYHICEPKNHTIRAGRRFKAGDFFSPRVWGNDINPKSGRSGPYQSKQIIIAPDIEIKKVWDIELYITEGVGEMIKEFYTPSFSTDTPVDLLATNDGLIIEDFWGWFNRPFEGQIICWNENINY